MTTKRNPVLRTLAGPFPWLLGFCLALTLVISALSGCDAASKGGTVDTGHQPCNVDTDCTVSGEVCSAHKVCLSLFRGAHPFGVELRPPEEPSWDRTQWGAAHEVAPLDLDFAAGPVVVTMPEAASLTCALTVVAESPAPLEATVTLSRASLIPGRPKVILTRNVQASGVLLRPAPDEVEPTFEALVSRDATYTLRAQPVSPFDREFHPLVFEDKIESDRALLFVFGDPEASIYVAGALVDALGQGVADVRVNAVAEDGSSLLSSTGSTEEDGYFHLRMPRGVHHYRLSFSPSTEGPDVPEVSRTGLLIGEQAELQGTDNSYDNPEDLGTFQLPAYPTPQRFLFHLVGRSSNGEDVNIPGATVVFSTRLGQASGLSGAYSTSAVSDDSGMVTAELVPGTTVENRAYDVLIIPPSDSEFAVELLSGEAAISVGAQGGAGPPIELLHRVAYAGQVLDTGLVPAVDVLVQARRLDGPEGIRGSLRSSISKADGRFSLKLDPGTYAIELIPPTGIPLPRWVLPDDLLVDETTSAVIDTQGLVLPGSQVLEIRVVGDADGAATPLSGITASIYLVDEFCAALNRQDHALCDREPVYIGEAVTDADGYARVLVPGE